jgi:hypothetical protein
LVANPSCMLIIAGIALGGGAMPRWFRRNWILIVGFSVLAAMVFGVVRFAEYLELYHGPITGVGTAVIGLFTVVLGVAAWYQLRHAREVDRAYLTAGGDLDVDAAGNAVFRFEIENIGRSAAIVTSYDVQFATWPQVVLPLPARPVNVEAHIHDDRFGPAGSTRSSFKAIMTNVLKPAVADVVYGAVWYTDIWQEEHCSRFILSIHTDGHAWADVGNVDERYRELT